MESPNKKDANADVGVGKEEKEVVAGKPAGAAAPPATVQVSSGKETPPVPSEATEPASKAKADAPQIMETVKPVDLLKASPGKTEGTKPEAGKPGTTAPIAEKGGKSALPKEPLPKVDPASPKVAAGSKDELLGKPASDANKSGQPKSADGGGKPPQAPVEPTSSKGGWAGLVLSVLALAAVGALGWQVYELRNATAELRQEVAQRLSGSETATAEVRALVRQNNEGLAALQGRFGAIESQVGVMEGQAATLELLYRESSRSRGDQVLAELEQAITIAGQQLQLAGNFEAALIALQGAEARLAAPEFAHLQALRRALIRDIEALKAHPQVDISGIALRLELVLERVASLPLAFEVKLAELTSEREAEAERARTEGDTLARGLAFARALGADIWGEVKGMVRLERLDNADPVLLGPEQSNYLKENVKIRLLTARLALLAGDVRTYVTDIERARDWLERYFDGSSDLVRRTLDELAELAATPIRGELPTLTDSFAALRLLQARGVSVEEPASAESGEQEAAR